MPDDAHVSMFMRVTLTDTVGPDADRLIAACIDTARASADNLDYSIFRDRQRADVLLSFERWADRAACDAHRATPAFTALQRHLAGPDGARIQGLDYAEVREIDPPYRPRPVRAEPAPAEPARAEPVRAEPAPAEPEPRIPAPAWAAAMPMSEAPWTAPALEPARIETPEPADTAKFELFDLETHGVGATPPDPAPYVEEEEHPVHPATPTTPEPPAEEGTLSRVGRWFRSLR